MKTNWDSELPPEICKKFKRWRNQLTLLKKIAIPRCLTKDPDNIGTLSIHVFCDASKTAYATCIYLRSESKNSTSCQLVQARSKVAPLKATTIPRLELLACCIGTRLMQRVIEDLKLENVPIFFWTDSSTALCWIKGSENWTPFVYNRVREIRLVSKPENWHYVPGSINPADLPSRGCSAQQLLETEWWHGPSWLYSSSDKWPKSEFSVNEEEVLKEKKKEIVSSMVSLQKIDNSFLYKFSSYSKTVRIVAWILRFIKNCCIPRNARKYGILDSEEISEAEHAVIRLIQKESFVNEEDEKLKTLRAFKDKNDIIRMKTKFLYRPMMYVADNDAQLVPLTQSMFLQGITVSGVPDYDRVDHQSLNKRVKYRQNLQKALRNRFQSEYFGALLQRPENKRATAVAVGDVVLIGSDNTKRISWPLGKIIEVMPGKDGVTRLVRLKTARGELLRPIQRLYPLEISTTVSSLISEKLPSAKFSEPPTVSRSVDCNIKPSEVEKKTRSGRIIRMPVKLDL